MAEGLVMSGWTEVARSAVAAASAYVLVVALLRASGKRTLSQLSLFDFVVTVAIGSMFGSMALGDGPTLAQGITAIAVVAALQGVVALATRSPRLARLITSEPALLMLDGRELVQVAARNRISREAIEQAARAAGHADATQVHAVVLETNGKLSVIGSRPAVPGPGYTALLERHGVAA